jgi:hypothetical protein
VCIVNQDEQSRYEASMIEYLKARVSRAQMLKAAGAGLAATALSGAVGADVVSAQAVPSVGGPAGRTQFPYFPQVGPGQTYQTENLQDLFNITVTAEYLAVTLLTAALANASQLNLSGLLLNVLQATLAEEQYHVDFLTAIGAKPLFTSFNLPSPALLTNSGAFLQAAETAETVFVGHYMTLTREFAELGQPTLAKYAYQIGAVEAEHRALVRAALALAGADHIPPNNKAFETDLFLYARDTARILTDLGFLSPTGTLAYPGRAAALAAAGSMASAVVQRTPNNVSTSPASTANFIGSVETITTTLSGSVETPAGDPNGTGTATVTLDAIRGQVTFRITVSGLSAPVIASHIHKGPVGVAGPVVVPFTPLNSSPNGTSSGTVSADPALIQDIAANPANYYVNVHTTAFPGGAIRGQLG